MSTIQSIPTLQVRRVQFDLSASPLQWIPQDPLASHAFNGVHLLLPAGELWFCRVFNKALPFVHSAELYEQVQGFIRQEAIHSRTHRVAETFLHGHGIRTEAYRQRVEWLFETLLGDAPLGIEALRLPALEKPWLLLRVGLIAAIEHFTGAIGQWCMDNSTLDAADPVLTDLFRWHLAEEVEHRSVAFDLYRHLCATTWGFYASRQALMALVYPLFLYFLLEGGRSLAAQDSDVTAQRFGRMSLLRLLWEAERIGRNRGNIPSISFLTRCTLRWVSPRFHPQSEGDTQQALDYMARSPAVQLSLQKAA